MSEPVLTLLKYVVLAVLYLFFLRVLRAVWVELREPKPAANQPAAVPVPDPPLSPAGPVPQYHPPAAHPPAGDAVPSGPGSHLIVTAPAERRGSTFAIGGELTIGRAPGCGISLPDDTFVSQLHARVFPRDGDIWVEDLGSTNGTFINRRKVTAPVPLRRGDQLQVGKTVLELTK